ncbi:Tautomerase MIF [Coniophora puteana RWD-64-598 SS2]|uniref:L-dopachrome isomerase n=1 Tax=Coniophora puteana (strain RWD-64-598) TaxID=741705 RepID=A0A5M3N2A3_CONPW|nr:Tautomerase MIF [Coniophora puteana RWD-64-598 SS2]EIW85513.1 Tautomerase MIF [Coniophora puteana RWD-64-598 SS2]
MPIITLYHNHKFTSDDQVKTFVSELSKACAKTIGKDESLFNINVIYNPYIIFGGKMDEPAYLMNILSIGINIVPHADTPRWSAEFGKFIEEKLGIGSDRGYISFRDTGADYIGFSGDTVTNHGLKASK